MKIKHEPLIDSYSLLLIKCENCEETWRYFHLPCSLCNYSRENCMWCYNRRVIEVVAGPDNATLQEIPCPECME